MARLKAIPSPEHDGLWAVLDTVGDEIVLDHVDEVVARGEADLFNETAAAADAVRAELEDGTIRGHDRANEAAAQVWMDATIATDTGVVIAEQRHVDLAEMRETGMSLDQIRYALAQEDYEATRVVDEEQQERMDRAERKAGCQ